MVYMSFELFQYYNRPKAERQFILDEIKTKGVEICEKCPDLCESRALYSYGKPTFGYGNINSPIMFVGEAPGKWGCGVTGIPFTGDRSGDYFQKMLKDGLNLQLKSVYTTNAVKCCPKDNRTPTPVERSNCVKWLMAEMIYVQPFLIVTLGMSATKIFMPEVEQFFKVHGRDQILGADGEIQNIQVDPLDPGKGHYKWSDMVPHNAMLYPTWHPSFVMRDTPHLEQRYLGEFKRMEKMMNLAFNRWSGRKPGSW
jgi:uracil-DNA glycosylase family 4